MEHALISGTDTHDLFSAVLQNNDSPPRRFCFHVESKGTDGWVWTACACDDFSLAVSGTARTRVDALQAAENAVDALAQGLDLVCDGHGHEARAH